MNEAPTIDNVETFDLTEEDLEVDQVVATLTATDPEGSTITYVFKEGSNDDGYFAFDGNNIVLTQDGVDNINDNEALTAFNLRVAAQDPELLESATSDVALGVTRVNEAPTIDNAIIADIDEGQAQENQVIITLDISDADSAIANVIFKNNTNDDGYFVVNPDNVNQILLTANGAAAFNDGSLDMEEYLLQVAAVDEEGLESEVYDANIDVNLVNDAPVINEVEAIEELVESEMQVGMQLAFVNATDIDLGHNETITFDLLVDDEYEGFFEIEDEEVGRVTLTQVGLDAIADDGLNIGLLRFTVQASDDVWEVPYEFEISVNRNQIDVPDPDNDSDDDNDIDNDGEEPGYNNTLPEGCEDMIIREVQDPDMQEFILETTQVVSGSLTEDDIEDLGELFDNVQGRNLTFAEFNYLSELLSNNTLLNQTTADDFAQGLEFFARGGTIDEYIDECLDGAASDPGNGGRSSGDDGLKDWEIGVIAAASVVAAAICLVMAYKKYKKRCQVRDAKNDGDIRSDSKVGSRRRGGGDLESQRPSQELKVQAIEIPNRKRRNIVEDNFDSVSSAGEREEYSVDRGSRSRSRSRSKEKDLSDNKKKQEEDHRMQQLLKSQTPSRHKHTLEPLSVDSDHKRGRKKHRKINKHRGRRSNSRERYETHHDPDASTPLFAPTNAVNVGSPMGATQSAVAKSLIGKNKGRVDGDGDISI